MWWIVWKCQWTYIVCANIEIIHNLKSKHIKIRKKSEELLLFHYIIQKKRAENESWTRLWARFIIKKNLFSVFNFFCFDVTSYADELEWFNFFFLYILIELRLLWCWKNVYYFSVFFGKMFMWFELPWPFAWNRNNI